MSITSPRPQGPNPRSSACTSRPDDEETPQDTTRWGSDPHSVLCTYVRSPLASSRGNTVGGLINIAAAGAVHWKFYIKNHVLLTPGSDLKVISQARETFAHIFASH